MARLGDLDFGGTKGIVFNGDSNLKGGNNGIPESDRYSKQIATAVNGVDIYNFARAGQVLQEVGGNYLTLDFIPVFDNTKYTFLITVLGTNDIPIPECNLTAFIDRYAVIVDNALLKGWTQEQIVLVTINYRGDLTEELYDKLLSYNIGIRNLAEEMGLVLIDLYEGFQELQDDIDSYFDAVDRLHLNVKGNSAAKDVFLNSEMVPYNPNPPEPHPDFLIYTNFRIV